MNRIDAAKAVCRRTRYVNVSQRDWDRYHQLQGQRTTERRMLHIAIFYSTGPMGDDVVRVLHPMLVGAITEGFAKGEPGHMDETRYAGSVGVQAPRCLERGHLTSA